MTREKKKIRSVAGEKFVPLKQEKRTSAAKAEYKARKQQNLARKKQQKSLLEKERDAEKLRQQNAEKHPSKRRPRLKASPAEVAERSRKLMADEDRESPQNKDEVDI